MPTTVPGGRRTLEPSPPSIGRRVRAYWMLTKPEVNFLVMLSTLTGFYLASRGPLHWSLLGETLIGTFLVASGTATLNEYVERTHDAQMRRTSSRPLPSGILNPRQGLVFGLVLSVAGAVILASVVSWLTCFLAVLTLVSYLALYTPLKRRTAFCTLVGALPGAVPPLIGWAAARGHLSWGAWGLYLILFLWQFPHFTAIAWMYREDYARAGYVMLPPRDRYGRTMAFEMIGFSALLIPATLVPVWLGEVGTVYLFGALTLGVAFFYFSARLAEGRSNSLARRALMASVVYLPLVYVLMMASKTPASIL
jgi:heme o synthase